jgi:methionine sulfoxide reductase heme-binding subunit
VHLTTNPVDWYAARAAGVVAYLLLSVVVTLGLTMTGRVRLARWPKIAIEDVHRTGGILVGVFVTLHVVTVAIDSFLPFALASLLVPGVGTFRPLWMALGIVAAELLLALAFTNHYRNRLVPYALWRRIHYLNFAVWLASTVHGLGSGTDRNAAWLLAIYIPATGLVAGAIVWRFLRLRPLAVGVAVGTGALVFGLAAGPFHVPRGTSGPIAVTFSGPLQAGFDRTLGPSNRYSAVVYTGVGGGRQQVWFRVDTLIESPQTLRSSSFVMAYLPSGLRCRGTITDLSRSSFSARCRTRRGARRRVDVRWTPSSQTSLLVDATISVRRD